MGNLFGSCHLILESLAAQGLCYYRNRPLNEPVKFFEHSFLIGKLQNLVFIENLHDVKLLANDFRSSM